jgi:hypothetical protein
VASRFQRLVKHLLRELKAEYPHVRSLESALAPSIPKASTFYFGESPTFAKHVFVNLQHSPKPWEAGAFTVNVLFTTEYGVPRQWHRSEEEFERFDEGRYRLASVTGPRDVWWCLLPRKNGEPWQSDKYIEYWVPSDFADDPLVVSECSDSVRRFLRDRLLVRGGFGVAAV